MGRDWGKLAPVGRDFGLSLLGESRHRAAPHCAMFFETKRRGEVWSMTMFYMSYNSKNGPAELKLTL